MKTSTKYLFLIQTVVFLTLTAFAVWDVSHIVYDYIYGNRKVAVTQHLVKDRFPFVQTAEINMKYRPDQHLFPRKIKEEDRYLDNVVERWRYRNRSIVMNLSSDHLKLTQAIFDLTLPTLIINELDESGPEQLHRRSGMFNGQINGTELGAIVDTFIDDRESIRKTIEAWTLVKPWYITVPQLKPSGTGGRLVTVDDPGIIPISMYHTNMLRFRLPIEKLSVGDTLRYALDMVYAGNDSEKLVDERQDPAALFSLRMSATDRFELKGGPGQETTFVTVSIYNAATYDSSLFPPCTKDFMNEDDCYEDLRVRAVQELCNCTQFSRHLRSALLNASLADSNSRRRFCTVKIYERCWDKAEAKAKMDIERAKSERTCKPCLFSKNMYVISKFANTIPRIDDVWFHRMEVNFDCRDTTYLQFEEEQQFNPSQFISQIGGDLGLYLGFSMVSALQALCFCWHYCKGSTKDTGDFYRPPWNRFGSALGHVMRSFGNCDKEAIIRTDMKRQDRCLQDVMKRLEALERPQWVRGSYRREKRRSMVDYA